MTSNDDETFIIETGVAKGIDALLKYNSKKLYVWFVYSLSYKNSIFKVNNISCKNIIL